MELCFPESSFPPRPQSAKGNNVSIANYFPLSGAKEKCEWLAIRNTFGFRSPIFSVTHALLGKDLSLLLLYSFLRFKAKSCFNNGNKYPSLS